MLLKQTSKRSGYIEKKKYKERKELSEVTHYDPETGILTWTCRVSPKAGAGDVVGHKDKDGYLVTCYNKQMIRLHRFILTCQGHNLEGKVVDHINGIPWDNRLINLRVAEIHENSWNAKVSRNNSSKVKGVNFANGVWRARIQTRGARVSLGVWNTLEEAEAAIKAYREVAHGDYCNHG